MASKFIVHCTNDKIWNLTDLIKFLANNQHSDIQILINPEAIDLSMLGLYELLDCFQFQSVEIVTHNQIEISEKYKISIQTQNEFLEQVLTSAANFPGWNKQKVFLTCYGRPTANRLGLAAYLDYYYPDQSIIHFSGGHAGDEIALYEIEKLSEFRLESIKETVPLIKKMPLLYNSNTNYNHTRYNFDDPITQCYENIFVDVVSETHVLGNTFFSTEKTTRPMWLKRPFIMFASRNYLDYLHQMGFQTFCDYWSEEYDGYEGRNRFLKILELIDSLSQLSIQELDNMYKNMQHILDHNYQLLMNQSYKKEITYIDQ